MTELEQKILEAQDAYYNGNPIMSDGDFDELWDKLKAEQPDSELLTEVGADHTDGFPKVKHGMIMGSQEKANTEDEMAAWLSKLSDPNKIGQFKMDGCSLALYYKDGKFYQAVTRGDGSEGDDITSNVLKMNGVVKELTTKPSFTGTIRGEVLISRENKDKYYPEKANCRNTASGIMKHLDGEGCEHLDVVVYDAQSLDGENTFMFQPVLQTWLKDEGFIVADWKMFPNLSAKEAMAYLTEVFNNFDNLKYDIDGIVWKQNEIDIEDFKTNYRPKTNIALKPARTYAETVVTDITWGCKNGTYTPVAVYAPTKLNGATNTHASLSNVDLMEKLGVEIGHRIEIVKAGLIIPKITKDLDTGKFVEGYY